MAWGALPPVEVEQDLGPALVFSPDPQPSRRDAGIGVEVGKCRLRSNPQGPETGLRFTPTL